jgi:hypothetical protein
MTTPVDAVMPNDFSTLSDILVENTVHAAAPYYAYAHDDTPKLLQ